jgi:hypothetical protein
MSGRAENRAHGASEKPVRREIILNLADAHNMLPLVRHIVSDIVENRRLLAQLGPEGDRLHRERRKLGWPERSRLYQIQEQIAAADHNLQAAIGELTALGLVIVDVERGRVGFPTVVNSRRALFSWQPGEPNIRFWHFPEEEERRPVPITWVKSANLTLSAKN